MESLKKRLGVFREITRDISPQADIANIFEQGRINLNETFEKPSQNKSSLHVRSPEFLNNSQAFPVKHFEAEKTPKLDSSDSSARAVSPTFKVPKSFNNCQKFGQKGCISQYQRKLDTPNTFISRNRHFNFDSSLESSGFLSNRSVNMKISTEESSREEPEERRKPKKRPLEESEKNYYIIRLDSISSRKDTRTTVMIKNIPNKYTQRMLLQTIDKKFSGSYDFLYLPIDFKNRCNVGYAFINFLNYIVITDFFKEFNNKRWEKFNSEKICSLAYARIQGLQDLVHHFQNSSVINQEDNKVKPIILSKN